METEPARTKPAAAARVLGFDYGTKRIGMAFGQRVTGTATALAVVPNGATGPQWAPIDAALREWTPDALVVGLPLALDGTEQAMTGHVRGFAGRLAERYRLPVHAHDERMSSIEAARRFAVARRAGAARARAADTLDSVAAQVIVESYLAATESTMP
jgi:putative Holliday junction resolvase